MLSIHRTNLIAGLILLFALIIPVYDVGATPFKFDVTLGQIHGDGELTFQLQYDFDNFNYEEDYLPVLFVGGQLTDEFGNINDLGSHISGYANLGYQYYEDEDYAEWGGLQVLIDNGVSFYDDPASQIVYYIHNGIEISDTPDGNMLAYYGGIAFEGGAFSIAPGSVPAPEPATILMLGTGLVGLAGIGRKKFRK